jgi:hypothetical protein
VQGSARQLLAHKRQKIKMGIEIMEKGARSTGVSWARARATRGIRNQRGFVFKEVYVVHVP